MDRYREEPGLALAAICHHGYMLLATWQHHTHPIIIAIQSTYTLTRNQRVANGHQSVKIKMPRTFFHAFS